MQDASEVRAVFVDPTGRRGRVVARTCWALGSLGVAYVALVLVSLLLPPGLSRLTVPGLGAVLPGPAAAPLGAVEEAPEVLLAPTRSPSPRTTASPGPRPSPSSARPTPTPTGGAPSPSGTAEPRPTTASTRAPTAPPARPTTQPTQRATQAPSAPPGSTRTPKPRPSPTRSPR